MNRILTDEILQFKVAVTLLLLVGVMFCGFLYLEAQLADELAHAGIDLQLMMEGR